MSELQHVKGLSELQKFFDQVPVKYEKNIARGGLRAGAVIIADEVKVNLAGHTKSGELMKGVKVSTGSKDGKVFARIRMTGKHAFVAHMLEFTGAVAHWIKAKKAKSLFIAGLMREVVHHPGFKAKPFARPALDAKASAAVVAFAEYSKRKLADKHGLDTADIEIEAQ